MATQKILRMPVKLDATGITGNNASAILEVNSTTQGLLPPRMTTAQRLIMSNVEGMLVYDTDLDTLYQNNGTAWTSISAETAATIATINHATSVKSSLVDADELTGQNSATSFSLIRTTMSNVWTYISSKLSANYYKPFDGIEWSVMRTTTSTTPYVKFWDGNDLGGGVQRGNNTLGYSTFQYYNVKLFSLQNSPYISMEAIVTVNISDNVTDIYIIKPSEDLAVLNLTISVNKALITNPSPQGYSMFVRKLTEGYGAITSNYNNKTSYSGNGQTQYWIGTGGIGSDNGFSVKTGTNRTAGLATLVAGTVTVSTTKVTENSMIFLTRQSISGTIGTSVDITARTAGISFTITSNGSVLETSTVAWQIIEPY